MRRRHGGGGLGGELIELAGGDALVDPGADLLRDEDGVAVLLAEPVAELLEPRGDLVEVHHLVAAVPLHHVHLPPARTSVEHLAGGPPGWVGSGSGTGGKGELPMKMDEGKKVGFGGRFKRLPCAARRAIINRQKWRNFSGALEESVGFWNGFGARARSRFPRCFGVGLGWWEARRLKLEPATLTRGPNGSSCPLWPACQWSARESSARVLHWAGGCVRGRREPRSVLHEPFRAGRRVDIFLGPYDWVGLAGVDCAVSLNVPFPSSRRCCGDEVTIPASDDR